MASSTQSGTIQTTFNKHRGGLRVTFSCPEQGYTLDDLDALRVAIDHARRKVLEQQASTPQSAFPTPGIAVAFTEQLARMAAPS